MKLRGFNLAPSPKVSDVMETIRLGANLLRYPFNTGSETNQYQWKTKMLDQMEHFRSQILVALPHDVTIVADLHTVWGQITNALVQKDILWFWKTFMDKFYEKENLIAGVLNEPSGTAGEVYKLMRTVHQFIKQNYGENRIVAISVPFCDPTKFKNMRWFDVDTWYEVQHYLPLNFTHQGIYNYPDGKFFPTDSNNTQTMKEKFAKVLEFKKYNPQAQLYISEFSCSNNADETSRYNYIKECISLFDSVNAHWTYNAWKEYEGWHPQGKVLEVLKRNLSSQEK